MQRSALAALAATLALASASALAQGGSLAGVTMRVLDDIIGIDAVVLDLELDASRADGGEGNAADGPEPTAPAEEAGVTAPDEPSDREGEPRNETDELREGGANRSP
jgi:hypothetical protein